MSNTMSASRWRVRRPVVAMATATVTAFSLAACSDDDSGDGSGNDSADGTAVASAGSDADTAESPVDLSAVILTGDDSPEGYAFAGDPLRMLGEAQEDFNSAIADMMGQFTWEPEECAEVMGGAMEALGGNQELLDVSRGAAFMSEEIGDMGDMLADPTATATPSSYNVVLSPDADAPELPDQDACREVIATLDMEGETLEMRLTTEDWDLEGIEVDGVDDLFTTHSTGTQSMMGQEIPVEEYNATGVVNGVRVNVTSQGDVDPAVLAELFALQVERVSAAA